MYSNISKVRIIRRILSFLVAALLLFFMGRILIQNWRNISFGELRFNFWWILLSWSCLFASFTLSAVIWAKLLEGLNIQISLIKAMKSIAVSQVGRYAPGRIWSYVGRAEMGKMEAIPRATSAVGLFVETELLVISASIVFLGGLTLTLGQWKGVLPQGLYLLLLLIPAELLLLHPRITNGLAQPLCRLIRREAPKVTLKYATLLILTFLYVAAWSLSGMGFYFMSKAVYPITWKAIIAFSSAYPAAWLIGFISLISPSGLGVREGILVLFLSPLVSAPTAITLSFLARIWTTAFEGICFLVFLRA
jgi:hypothetical protein